MKIYTLASLATAASLLAFGAVSAQTGRPLKVKLACAADVQRLCPNAAPGRGYVMQCLKSRMNEVSPDCQSAVQEAKAKHAQRRAAAAASQPAPDAAPPQ